MKILIAGCGIGGLSAAHALTKEGWEVQLVEKAPQLKPVGAGISLQPNALQALERLDVVQQIRDAAWAAESARVMTSRGKILTQFDFSNYQSRFGYLPMTIFRGDLIRILAELLDQKPGRSNWLLDDSIREFESTGDRVVVTTESGLRLTGDVLIGADGIHSAVGTQLFGERKLRYAGYTCWRGMVEEPGLVNQVDTMTEVWGVGARFGFMRCNERQVYWFATENRKLRSDHLKESGWRSRFKEWISPIPQLLEATPESGIVQNDIVDLKPIVSWGHGRVKLLGDAAHAMTPNFGQGGAQAIEDAVVLGLALKKNSDPLAALEQYEKLRIGRTTELVKGSLQFGWIGQGAQWYTRLIRNYIMPNLPKRFVDHQLAKQCDFEAYLASTNLL